MVQRIAVAVVLLLAISQLPNCGSDTAGGGCRLDADCQPGVCLDGECRDCRANEDCPYGQVCQDNNCVVPYQSCEGDATCNHNGSCDDSTGTIVCTCFEGYTGMRCEACAEGYEDPGDGTCVPSDPCWEDTICLAENRECQNLQGQAVCTDCLAGYHEVEGLCVEDVECLPTTCSGHGNCDDSTGELVCTCDPGYAGLHCEECSPGYVLWPVDGDTCVDDPCDPYPCDVPNALPDGCIQTDVDQFVCECESGFVWDGEACGAGVCTDADGDGYGQGEACLGPDCDDADAEVFEGNDEICDGKDNDCDGVTDEDFPDLGRPCDGMDSDECATGTWTCTPDGTGLECVNESGTGIPETCDGQDNDCDGETDEDFVDLDQPCDGADSDLCQNGTWTCTADGIGLECVNETDTDILDVCDGEDNDCDPSSSDGDEDPQNGAACDGADSDLCPEGTYSCISAQLVCDDDTGDDLDVCDGLDNDCDPASSDGDEDPQNGAACDGADGDLCEEGTLSCLSAQMTCSDNTSDNLDICDGQDNDCDPASLDGDEDPDLGSPCDGADSDLCEEGTYSCTGSQLVCSDATSDDLDICDGEDNDCDPASPDGSEDPQIGVACDGPDGDLCQEGTYSCVASSLTCSDNTADELDICDGQDNDCDPSSPDGSEDPQVGTACDGADSDLCQEGVLSCVASSLSCSDNTGDDLDVCDGQDNDCDPSSPDGSEDPLIGTACDGLDSDLCEEGTYSCVASSLACSDNTSDDLDICDGQDNDCNPASPDGSQDPQVGAACDGNDSDLCEEGILSCVAASLTCGDNTGDTLDVCDGQDNDCDPSSPDGSEDPLIGAACDGLDSDLCAEGTYTCVASSLSCSDVTSDDLDICDGLDNDCDPGSPDGSEDPLTGVPCDGADSDLCEEGTSSCVAGSITCSDTTGDTLDICDGADNDCDPSSPDGSEDPLNGAACDGPDSDLCEEGTYSCAASVLVCGDASGDDLDICDGLDNDCDPGSPDGSEDPLNGIACDGLDSDLCLEGISSCVAGAISCDDVSGDDLDICDGLDNDCDPASSDGDEDPQNGAACDGPDSDLCEEGTYGCSGGSLVCSDSTTDTLEQCNGLDDDCDGETDEDFDPDDNPACSDGTDYLGTIDGDIGSDVVTDSHWDEEWDRVTIYEARVLPVYLSAHVELYSPPGVDFDLYVYCNNCAGGLAGSATGHSMAGHWDTVEVRTNDVPFADDTFDIIIEVRHYDSNICAYWDLTVTGNLTVNNETCN